MSKIGSVRLIRYNGEVKHFDSLHSAGMALGLSYARLYLAWKKQSVTNGYYIRCNPRNDGVEIEEMATMDDRTNNVEILCKEIISLSKRIDKVDKEIKEIYMRIIRMKSKSINDLLKEE